MGQAEPPAPQTPQTPLESITAQLRAARRARRLTQQALADGLGVSALAIGSWEQGKDVPGLGNFIRCGEAVGFTVGVEGAASQAVPVPRAGESWVEFRIRCLTSVLVDARERLDRTQEMVGDTLGVSAWTVHMWETGHRVPRTLRLIEWCRALGCDLVLVAR